MIDRVHDFKDIFELQDYYPNNKDMDAALDKMTNAEIDKLIATCGTPQGKLRLKKHKK